MNSTGPYASAALHGHPTWKYRWEAPRSSPVPNHLSRLLNRFHQKIYAPLSIQLVGNSFVSPTLSLPLSLKHPAAPPSPRTRSPEARGRLVAGVFDAAIAACWCWCVVCCCCCLWNDPARAYCLLLDLGGSIGRAQHTHTHTLREVAELAINNRYMLWCGSRDGALKLHVLPKSNVFTVRSDICLLYVNFVI